MNTAIANSNVAGANITPLDSGQASAWLNWVTGIGVPPAENHGVRFSLAHSDSGVTWGFLDGAGKWNSGAAVDPGLCPIPTAKSLHELRVFGYTAEVLIWRGDDELQGRILADDCLEFDASDPLYPMKEGRRLRGQCSETRGNFKRYVDTGGAQHLAPESFPEEFSVRHYFDRDLETGAVRIAATRMVPEKLP